MNLKNKIKCDSCGTKSNKYHTVSYGKGSSTYCDDCFHQYYDYCLGCGKILFSWGLDDDEHYCEDCYWRHRNSL